jgi:hypothetical protein
MVAAGVATGLTCARSAERSASSGVRPASVFAEDAKMSTLGKKCSARLIRPGYLDIVVTVEFDKDIEGKGSFVMATTKYELHGSYVLVLEDKQTLIIDVYTAPIDDQGVHGRFTSDKTNEQPYEDN